MANVKSAEEYRALALLCRQQAPIDPDKRWDLLAQAERWEYLAEQKLVASDYPAHRLGAGCPEPLYVGPTQKATAPAARPEAV